MAKFLVKLLKCIGMAILSIVSLIPFGIAGAIVTAAIVAVSGPPKFFSEILMVVALSVLGLTYLICVSFILNKIALWKAMHYLKGLPTVDFQVFRNAYPEYEEDFLLRFRQVVAICFRTTEGKISPDLDLSATSPLRVFGLNSDLFEAFCPPSVKDTIDDFPIRSVGTFQDFVRETNDLTKRSS